MHLTEVELQSLADGELTSPPGMRARQHVAACAACAEAVARRAADDREVADLLSTLDHRPPLVSPHVLITRAGLTPRVRWAALAAGIGGVALAVLGAAAAVPNSPLRTVLQRLVRPERSGPSVHQSSQPSVASVGFAPAGAVSVTFTSPQASGEIGISLSDSPLVRIALRGGSASYTVTATGMIIANGGSGASYDVTLPRMAVTVRIRVGDRVVFARDGAHMSALMAPDREGHYVIPFAALAAPAR